MTLKERLGDWLGLQRRSYASEAFAAAYQHYSSHAGVSASLEASAGMIGRALSVASISGDGARYFTPATLNNIGRALILEGEYAGVILTGKPLVQLFEFDIVGDLISYSANGQEIETDRALHVRYSDGSDGHGVGPLGSARALHQYANNAERVLKEELGGLVGSLIALPKVSHLEDHVSNGITIPGLKTQIKGMKGSTAFVETMQQGGSATGIPQPPQDYKQIKLRPELHDSILRANDAACKMTFLACGIPPTMVTENQQPSREAIRQFFTLTIEPMARLIEIAARDKGIEIDLDFNRAARFDVAGRSRAASGLVSAGYTRESVAQELGFHQLVSDGD